MVGVLKSYSNVLPAEAILPAMVINIISIEDRILKVFFLFVATFAKHLDPNQDQQNRSDLNSLHMTL